MKATRITRVNEIIRRELATQLYRLVHRPDFDPAAVTVTHVMTAVDLRTARVLVSIRAKPEEQERMLHILKSMRAEFQEALKKNVILRYTPHLQFVLDQSIAQGDNVLQILNQLQADGQIPSNPDELPPPSEPVPDAAPEVGAPGADDVFDDIPPFPPIAP